MSGPRQPRYELAFLALAALVFLAGIEIRDALVASLDSQPNCSPVPYELSARPKCVLWRPE